jgi:Ca-activated chloride channel family protein
MVDMGQRGAGNHYYGETAADLFEPFGEEFDLIANLHARHVRLSLAAPQGVGIRLLNDYPTEERDGFPLIRLPDLPWGAEAWALVELEIPADLAREAGMQLLQAAVSGATVDGTPIACQDATLALEVVPPQAWEVLLPDPVVLARRAELEAGKLLGQARAAAEHGDWAAIQRMIAEAQQQFADHPWVMEVLAEMAELAAARDGARFRKEALYSAGRMDRRLAAKAERLADLDSEEAEASYLRRKKAQGRAQFAAKPEGDR